MLQYVISCLAENVKKEEFAMPSCFLDDPTALGGVQSFVLPAANNISLQFAKTDEPKS